MRKVLDGNYEQILWYNGIMKVTELFKPKCIIRPDKVLVPKFMPKLANKIHSCS
jgi:hypothetical protein